MEISEQGIEEVKKNLDFAMKIYDRKRQEYLQSLSNVKAARLQAECAHKNIEIEKAYLYDYIVCKDCGYKWQEL